MRDMDPSDLQEVGNDLRGQYLLQDAENLLAKAACQNETVDGLFDLLQAQIGRDRYEAVDETIRRLEEVGADADMLHYVRGQALLFMDKNSDAIDEFSKVDVGWSNSLALVKIAMALAGTGRVGDAEAALERAERNGATLDNVYYVKGIIAGERKLFRTAIEWLDKLIGINPNDYHALVMKAGYLRMMRRYVAARDLLVSITERRPQYHIAWESLGWAYLSLHDMPRAEEAFKRVIAIAPEDTKGYRGLSRVCLLTFRWREAWQKAGQAAQYVVAQSELRNRLAATSPVEGSADPDTDTGS